MRQGNFQEARTKANETIALYPGHLRGLFLAAAACLRLGEPQQARLHLDSALGLDPENAECRLALAQAFRALGETDQSNRLFTRAFALMPSESDQSLILNGGSPSMVELKAKGESSPLGHAVRFRLSVNWGRALPDFQAITRSDPFLPEAWLGLAESLWRLNRLDEAMSTLEQIASAWPNFVKAALICGDILLRQGQTEAGVAFLHNAQALDPSGIVAQRTLGWQDQYIHLWADTPLAAVQDAEMNMAVPHSLSDDGEVVAETAAPLPSAISNPTLREIELEMSRLTDHFVGVEPSPATPSPAPASALVILTSKTALEREFGAGFLARLGDSVQGLIQAIGIAEGRAIHYVAVDDQEQMAGLGGIAPQDPGDSAQVKAAIDSLADGLLTQRNDLRHLLILGDDDIVPFCRVANPTDDQDEDIYTDAPYAARNGSSLLPTRSVGRLPDCGDADTFLHLVECAVRTHGEAARVTPASKLRTLSRILKRAKQAEPPVESIGYTASVWKEAARAVFETIGQPRHLRMSPPVSHREFASLAQANPRFSYFNLHGVEGEPAWYGQRDPDFAADYPLFPIALLPQDIKAERIGGTTVFTEACYGADVLGRTAKDAIALRFLAEGARGVVGSTRLAYGSLTPPLAGADLLGRFFWLAVLSGMPIGQSLQWAKLSFASDLVNRQGYLDSEDQKTLLTFNLFGDPTLTVEGQVPAWDKLPRSALVSKSLAVCCQNGARAIPVELPAAWVDQVEGQIARRLPWLTPKRIRVTQQVLCSNQSNGGCHSADGAEGHSAIANRYVFTVSGVPEGADSARWPLIAKVTVDHKGTILKMAVSRTAMPA
jgi:tetratricopeptide (TPR) repeat protein